ncbi:unnamed protein product [Rotaria sp. Silwood2]|nr:unnamed protein product [Rotaria sp. Silwood2]
MVNIGISCVLTLSTHRARIDYLLSSNEHIVSLLNAATIIRDNIILNMNQFNKSNFVKNMMRLTERVLFMLQLKIIEILEKSAYQSLNEFATIYWAVILINGTMDGKWQKRTNDPYTSWYECRYESRQLSIDCSNGTFLIDGMTIGLAFEYNSRTTNITSRKYSDMCIDEDQWLETLTGLTFGLLLSSLSVNNHEMRHYPYRKLIVPFGTMQGKRNKDTNHQTVTIDRLFVKS